MDTALRYPGNGSSAGLSAFVIVSPTRQSRTFLILAATQPTEPHGNSWTGNKCGVNTPNSVTSKSLELCIIRMVSFTFKDPSCTRTYAMAPL